MQIYDGREQFYQWDLDQKITSNTFNVGDEVHFGNIKHSTALVVLAYELNGKVVADVPNVLLQSFSPITAYHYITTDHGVRTTEEESFLVNKRVKPDDYVYTETEVLTYKALDERITLLENTKPDIESPSSSDQVSHSLQVLGESENVKEALDVVENYVMGQDLKLQDLEISANTHDNQINGINQEIGSIETALDSIIAIQNEFIGGAE